MKECSFPQYTYPIGDQLKEWFKDWIKSEEGQAVLGEAIEELFGTHKSESIIGNIVVAPANTGGDTKCKMQ